MSLILNQLDIRMQPERRHAPTLLGAQLLFNVGFYAVVPFLTLVLTDDFGLASTAVGLVLGVRTFAQQGMFLAGGILTDRFGARGAILAGCGVRTAGFLTLAASLWPGPPSLPLFIAGTVLTGLGGALFSPALNTLVADADAPASEGHRARRTTLFAWLTVAGEIGATIGPLAGAALLGWGFAVVAASGAGLFVLIGGLLWWTLPHSAPGPRSSRGAACGRPDPWAPFADRRFVAFCALQAVDLLAYNQLYLTLPFALRVVGGDAQLLAMMFAWVSILTLTLQLPLARWCAHAGPRIALRTGHLVTASGFGTLAAGALVEPGAGGVALPMLAASLLIVGHLIVNPTALSRVPAFAGERPTGAFFGLLSTMGGIAVLLGNLAVGRLLDVVGVHPEAGVLPWLFLAALPVTSALLIPRFAR